MCEDCKYEFTALFASAGCYAGHPDLMKNAMGHPPHLATLVEELFRHVGESEAVIRTGDCTSGYLDRCVKCHENVVRWSGEHPEDLPVRGLLMDQSQVQSGFIEFLAHSLVDAAGCGLRT